MIRGNSFTVIITNDFECLNVLKIMPSKPMPGTWQVLRGMGQLVHVADVLTVSQRVQRTRYSSGGDA